MENYLVKNVIKKNSGENHKHNDNEIGIALYYITIKDLKDTVDNKFKFPSVFYATHSGLLEVADEIIYGVKFESNNNIVLVPDNCLFIGNELFEIPIKELNLKGNLAKSETFGSVVKYFSNEQ